MQQVMAAKQNSSEMAKHIKSLCYDMMLQILEEADKTS
jgi:hypothetical protein